jgi:hypothetical protein
MDWYNTQANPQDLISFQSAGLPYNQGAFVNDQPMARQQMIDLLQGAKNAGLNYTLTGGYGGGHASPEHRSYGTAVDLVPQGKTNYQALQNYFTGHGGNVLTHNAGSGMHIHLTPGQSMIAGGISNKPASQIASKPIVQPVSKPVNPTLTATSINSTKPSGYVDKIVRTLTGSSPVGAEPLTGGVETKRIIPDKGAEQMNPQGYLGILPRLGATQSLTDSLLQRGGQMSPMGQPVMAPGDLDRLLAQMKAPGGAPGMNAQMPSQNPMMRPQMPSPAMNPMGQSPQGMPSPGGMPQGASQGMTSPGAMPPQQRSQQPVPTGAAAPQKKGFNMTPLSLALIGIGQNLMHPAGSGEFAPLANYLSQSDQQDKQQTLEREKMQLDKDLAERKFKSTEDYQNRLLALQEKELNMKTQESGTGDLFGGNKNPALTALRMLNNPDTMSKLTPEVQGLLKQYANNAVKDPNALYDQEQAKIQGNQAGQTGLTRE